jgi:hypothetical protein
MTRSKANGADTADFDKGWRASEVLTKLILDYLKGARTEDERHGFEAGLLCVFPHGVLLDEIGFRLSETEDDEAEDDAVELS